MAQDVLVSLDLGNGWSKVRSGAKTLSFQSVISEESQSINFDMAFSPNGDFVIEFEGKRYAVGDTVYRRGLMAVKIAHRSRLEMDFYRVLFAAGLAGVVGSTANIKAVVSLPTGAYWDKEKMKETLAGEYMVKLPSHKSPRTLTYTVDYNNIRVIPEGVGTVCMFVLDDRGGERDTTLFNRVVGVVDVGTYTTDLIKLEKLKIVRAGTGSYTVALQQIHQRLKDFASGMGVDIPDEQLDSYLQKRHIMKHGQRVPIDAQIDEWGLELAKVIEANIRTLWRGGDDIEYILLTGGGSGYVFKHLQTVFGSRVDIVEDSPHFANANGGYRYGLLHERAGR